MALALKMRFPNKSTLPPPSVPEDPFTAWIRQEADAQCLHDAEQDAADDAAADRAHAAKHEVTS